MEILELDKLRIALLAMEYNTLRTEILARSRERFATMGLLITLVAAKFEVVLAHPEYWPWVAAVVAFFAFVVLRLGRIIKTCSDRIKVIEVTANAIVGATNLICWESEIANQMAFTWLYGRSPTK